MENQVLLASWAKGNRSFVIKALTQSSRDDIEDFLIYVELEGFRDIALEIAIRVIKEI